MRESNKLDRSEDDLINIRDPEYYDMSATEKEFHLLSDEESDDSSSVESEISYDEGKLMKTPPLSIRLVIPFERIVETLQVIWPF